MFTMRHLLGVFFSCVVMAAWLGGSTEAQVQPAGLHQTTIKGLAAIAGPDGVYHGKAIGIIATPSDSGKVRLVGTTDREMQIAMEEAIRLVKLRHPDVQKQGIEISFTDKYSTNDGGSAGTAIALVVLSAYGDFALNPDAAITGDITVDGKVQSVGAVAAKVHGAALDHMAIVAIPAADTAQIEDAILLDGSPVLWEIPIFSLDTLDDAIAITRKDPDPKLAQAIKAFADLKLVYGSKPVETLKDGDGAAKLTEILNLAPNFVSVKELQQLAAGNTPKTLSLIASVQQAFAALGPTRMGLTGGVGRGGQPVSDEDQAKVHKNLDRVKEISDPAAAPLFGPLNDFVDSYVKFANIPGGAAGAGDRIKLRQEVRSRQSAIQSALEAIISDSKTVDKLLHG